VLQIQAGPVLDPSARLWTVHHLVPGLHALESNAGGMGEALEWIAGLLFPGVAHPVLHLLAEAAGSPPGAAGTLSSFGAEVMDARRISLPIGTLTASPLLTAGDPTRRRHVARCVLEGMAFALRANVEQIEAVSGRRSPTLRLAGGMSRSDLFAEITSQVLGRPVELAAVSETSALGAAICAGVGAGLFRDLAQGADALARVARTWEPLPERASLYGDLYAGWEALRVARADSDARAAGIALRGAATAAKTGSAPSRVAAFRPRPIGLVQTRLPGTKESVLDKTTAAVNDRLAALGCPAVTERRCAHETAPLAEAIAALADGTGLLLVSGASAITDRRDVVPAAIERAGGRVEHFGMPVDPGNLLLLARLGAAPVLGLPGCARSPKLNGFDWVLQRLLADLAVSRRDIMLMGAGGLLMEIPTRPQPRAGTPEAKRPSRVAAVVLAAGRSSRMGVANKLLAEVDGSVLVAHAVDAALASRASAVVVVTGHEAERVRAALAGRAVTFVHNPEPAAGLSGSLKRGLAALGPEVDGALICLADMPRVDAAALDRLIAAFDPLEGRSVCVPVWNGKRGNPVLWARRFFAEMAELAGDVGARHLIGAHAEVVCEVAMPDDAVLVDIDTPEALAAVRARADDRPA